MKTIAVVLLFGVASVFTTACGSDSAEGSSSCGDGTLTSPEECDDGANVGGDGCAPDCTTESGFNCTGDPSVCASTCGDEIVAADEECDNNGSGGCSSSCTEELGWSCDPTCQPICGDGLLRGIEECDDEGLEALDGCDANCVVESTTHQCDGSEPSLCSLLCGLDSVAVWHDSISDPNNPFASGPGWPAVWSYAGQVGITAGDEACRAIGADHVCSYQEVIEAQTRGELSEILGGTTFWLHRTIAETFTVDNIQYTSPPAGTMIELPAGLFDWFQGGLTDGETKYHNASSLIRVPLITSSTINAGNSGAWNMDIPGAYPFFHETNPSIQRGAVFVIP